MLHYTALHYTTLHFTVSKDTSTTSRDNPKQRLSKDRELPPSIVQDAKGQEE